MTAQAAAGSGVEGRGALLFARLRPFTGLIALVVLCVLFGTLNRSFLSPANFFNILNAVAIVGILAIGQAFPLIGGGFDLSQGAVASLSGVVTASLMSRYGLPIPVAVCSGLLLGAALGWINGMLVARGSINPFVATLGTQTAFFGLTLVYSGNRPQSLGPEAAVFKGISYGTVGPFSSAAILFLVLVVVLFFVLRYLPYGQHIYALGGNEEAARLAGINTSALKVSTYVLSGLLAAGAAMVMIARAGQASPVEGQGDELDSLASCIIGGIALGGGTGSAWNVFIGALTLQTITNGLQMSGSYSFWGYRIGPELQLVIRGVIILLAVAVDARARAGLRR